MIAASPLRHARTPPRHPASNTITVPPIRWLAILPPIIMIGGAVVLLGRGLAGPHAAAGRG